MKNTENETQDFSRIEDEKGKDLGHFWLGYIGYNQKLGHFEWSASKFHENVVQGCEKLFQMPAM